MVHCELFSFKKNAENKKKLSYHYHATATSPNNYSAFQCDSGGEEWRSTTKTLRQLQNSDLHLKYRSLPKCTTSQRNYTKNGENYKILPSSARRISDIDLLLKKVWFLQCSCWLQCEKKEKDCMKWKFLALGICLFLLFLHVPRKNEHIKRKVPENGRKEAPWRT